MTAARPQKEGKSVKVTFIGGPEMALGTAKPANKKKEPQKQKSDPTLTDEQSTIWLEREISGRDCSAIFRRKSIDTSCFTWTSGEQDEAKD